MHRLRYCAVALAGATCLAFAMGGTAGAQVDQDNGGASGLSASLNLPIVGTVNIPPTPNVNLPPLGGSVHENVVSLDVPHVVSAAVLDVQSNGTTGPGGSVTSAADVATANVLEDTVTADVVHSDCLSDESGSSGNSALVDASVAGNPIEVSPPANTSIPVPAVGTVILNEQQESNAPGSTSIVVNAVHVALDGIAGTGDVIVSQSRCGVAGAAVLGETVTRGSGAGGVSEAGPAAASAIGSNPNLAG